MYIASYTGLLGVPFLFFPRPVLPLIGFDPSYALIQPISEANLEELEWRQLAKKQLARAWQGEEDAL